MPMNKPTHKTNFPQTLTVQQLCNAVEDAIKSVFPKEVWIEGVISSLRRSPNGHVYFDLLDSNEELGASTKSVISVTLFSSNKQFVNRVLKKSGTDTRMEDGIKIRIRGEVNYYPPQGKIQLIMSQIDPTYTLGQMAADKDKLLKELASKNLLKENSKRQLSKLPLRIGLITSYESAAYADFTTQLDSSPYPYEITVFDCRVQGIDAVPSLVRAISEANKNDLDVIAIVRGGGARSDLVAFDHKNLVYAITESQLAVITGIGHEIDRSVADEVAHTTAKTPTAAAVVIINLADQAASELEQNIQRLKNTSQRYLELSNNQLTNCQHRLKNSGRNQQTNTTQKIQTITQKLFTLSTNLIQTNSNKLDNKTNILSNKPKQILIELEHKLQLHQISLRTQDPKLTMARGWTITRDSKGQLIKNENNIKSGESITTTTASGTIYSDVTKTESVDSV